MQRGDALVIGSEPKSRFRFPGPTPCIRGSSELDVGEKIRDLER